MKTTFPKTVTGLITSGETAITALVTHGVAINIAHVTSAMIQDVVNKLVTRRNNHKTSKATLKEKQLELKANIRAARIFIMKYRDVLKDELGSEPSAAWEPAGFPSHSHAVPESAGELQMRAQQADSFLTAHPEHEVPSLSVSAGEANVLTTKLRDGREAIIATKIQLATHLNSRRAAEQEMLEILRNLRKELSHRLTPLDERWKAFGFNLPGATATPDVPENLVAVLIGSNAVSMQWSAAPRAEHYRVWKRVLGVDAEFVAAGSPSDLDFTVQGLPSNKQVEVSVSAVNNGGESQRSAIATVTTL